MEDVTLRALRVLRDADVLFAEDTRVLLQLLRRLGVPLAGRPVNSCHEFNEEQAASSLIGLLRSGKNAAMVSDAGTPLISDPGFMVLRRVREELGHGIPVRPVPGASAALAALSVAGVPANKFLFAGFLPPKQASMRAQLQELLRQARAGPPATLVLYESPHHIVGTLRALAEVLDEEGSLSERRVAVCRELTKPFETRLVGDAREVLSRVEGDPVQQKGEFVVLVEGGKKALASPGAAPGTMLPADVVRLLSAEMTPNKAARLAAKICGASQQELKKQLYRK